MKKDKLYKSLETIALAFSKGDVSIDTLIAGCDRYKEKTNFEDGYNYQVLVSKSCYDYLNEVEQDVEIVKAILPGQTKVIDGVLYVWSPTAPGSAQPYDWHVADKVSSGKKTINVGKGSKLKPQQRDSSQKSVNELFPHDLKSLTPVINPKTGNPVQLGGSTGAELVQDSRGREYVKKVGTGARKEHVAVEYFANQIYELLGFKAKKCELYDEGQNEKVLLSTYERGLKIPTTADYKKMADGFMLDVLLANWDVYRNDNCLVDAAGNIHRIDNGGVFSYKAQGRIDPKKFTDDVVETFNGMVRFNGNVYQYLTEADLHNQINAIKAKKDEIVAYMRMETSLQPYADIMEKRIDNLDNIFNELNKGKNLTQIPIQPRKLKTHAEMYRELNDEELTEIRDAWCNLNGVDYDRAPTYKDRKNHGWELLNEICSARGFTARPEVVTEDEFWDRYQKGEGKFAFSRGMGADKGAKVGPKEMAINTLFEDKCYYGTIGAYGEGIYGAKWDKNANRGNFKGGWAFGEASGYARSNGGSEGVVIKAMFSKDANVITYSDLAKEAQNYSFDDSGKNAAEVKKLEGEIKVLDGEILALDDEIRNFSKNIENEVHKEFNFDPVNHATLITELEGINWDKKDISGDPDLPSYNDVVVQKIVPYMQGIGAEVYTGNGLYRFTIPNSNETITISQYQYENSVKRKNSLSPSYNYTISRLTDYLQRKLVKPIENEITNRIANSQNELQKLYDDKQKKSSERDKKVNSVNDLRNNGNRPSEKDSFMAQVTGDNAYGEMLGLYAAARGYDGIYSESANYMVVLNRSKLIVSNEVDYI